jgi:hypothetical protein
MPSESDTVWGVPSDAATKAQRRYPVPQDSAFGDDEVLRAPDLQIIADRLIRTQRQFKSLAFVKIRFYWKKKGGSIEGIAKRMDPFLKKETSTDTQTGATMMVWLAADNLRDRNASELYVERTMFDALLSIDADREGAPGIAPHDVQIRFGTILRYGPMTNEERALVRVMEQAPTELSGIDLTSSKETAAEGPGRVEHDIDDDGLPPTEQASLNEEGEDGELPWEEVAPSGEAVASGYEETMDDEEEDEDA